MNHTRLITTRAMLTASIVCAGAALAQDYAINWHTIDSGGVMSSTGGGFELSGTIGQADASSFDAPMTGGTYSLTGGFWVVPTGESVAGDFDGDGDVDLDDYADFESCLCPPPGAGPCSGGGPDVPAGAGCEFADFDGDGDADLKDFRGFQAAFTGS